jgi:hypothetical protein
VILHDYGDSDKDHTSGLSNDVRLEKKNIDEALSQSLDVMGMVITNYRIDLL